VIHNKGFSIALILCSNSHISKPDARGVSLLTTAGKKYTIPSATPGRSKAQGSATAESKPHLDILLNIPCEHAAARALQIDVGFGDAPAPAPEPIETTRKPL
jgi:hypothetical protein